MKRVTMSSFELNADGRSGVSDKGIPETSQPRSEMMLGLAKGLRVLEAFSENNTKMTISDIARVTGYTRASIRRCVITLTNVGYMNFDGKYYEPTPRLLRLVHAYLKVAQLPKIAQPILEELKDSINESISLAVLEEQHSVFIARAESERILTRGLRIGTRLPAPSCATGRVLLSSFSDEALEKFIESCPIEKITHKTITDKNKIMDIIKTARINNYAILDEELEIGVRGLASPVKNSEGNTIAAISMSAFSQNTTSNQLIQEFLPALAKAANKIGKYF